MESIKFPSENCVFGRTVVAFVGVPLPGTGAWTGSLIAAMLELPLRRALPAIALGVLLAGAAVGLATTSVLTVLA